MDKLKQTLNRFLDSEWFTIVMGAFTVLAWTFQWEIAGPLVLMLLGSALLLFRKDLKPLFVIVCFAAFTFYFEEKPYGAPPMSVTQTYITTVIAGGSVLFLSLVWYFIRTFAIEKKKPNFGKLWIGMLLAGAVSVLSGVLNPDYNKINVLLVFAVSAGMYIVYFLMINSMEGDLRKFACKVMVAAGLIIFIECMIYFAKLPDPIFALENKVIRTGWGMSNSIATLFVMAIPAALYLCIDNRKSWVLMAAVGLFIIGELAMLSRGNFIITAIVAPIALIYSIVKTKYKGRMIAATAVFAGILLTIFLINREEFVAFIQKMIKDMGTGGNGRTALWKEAWQRFLDNKIFGSGYMGWENSPFVGNLWKVHCTPLQIISSAGIVGAAGFLLFYFQRYKLIFSKFSMFKLFAFAVVGSYEAYGFIDLTFFIIYQIFFVFLFLAACEKETDQVRRPAFGRGKMLAERIQNV